MNPRRVHELMRTNFPPVEHATRDWVVVQNEFGVNIGAIVTLLADHIASPEVLVEVHRKLGTVLSVADAPEYISNHIGEGEIHISDRQFTGFIVVASNGVATGWHLPANPSLQRIAPGDR